MPTITFDASYTRACIADHPATLLGGRTASFTPAFTNYSRKVFASLSAPPRHHPADVPRRRISSHVAVSPVRHLFVERARSNAPTSPIKVAPFLILINRGYLSIVMGCFRGITRASVRPIKRYPARGISPTRCVASRLKKEQEQRERAKGGGGEK